MIFIIDWEKYSAPKDSNKHTDWVYSSIIPDSAERVVQYVSGRRQLFFAIHPDAGSNVDADYEFNSFWKVALYIPKAYCNVYFAPYPTMWFQDGVKTGGGLQRKIAALEMITSYLCFLGVPVALIIFYKRREIWLFLWFSLSMTLFLGLAVPNIGSLYRIRYGFFMIMLCVGVIGWASLLKIFKYGTTSTYKIKNPRRTSHSSRRSYKKKTSYSVTNEIQGRTKRSRGTTKKTS